MTTTNNFLRLLGALACLALAHLMMAGYLQTIIHFADELNEIVFTFILFVIMAGFLLALERPKKSGS
jgi:hypothetical protein